MGHDIAAAPLHNNMSCVTVSHNQVIASREVCLANLVMIWLHTRVLLISLFVHLSRQLHVSQSISVRVHIPSWYSVPSVSIFRETLKEQHVHGVLKDEHQQA